MLLGGSMLKLIAGLAVGIYCGLNSEKLKEQLKELGSKLLVSVHEELHQEDRR